MIIKAPKFNLAKEKTWALWLGVVVFSIFSLALMVVPLLPYLPRQTHRPGPQSEVWKNKEKQGIPLDLIDLADKDMDIEYEKIIKKSEKDRMNNRDVVQELSCTVSGTILMFGTVIPLAREIRRRKKSAKSAQSV